MSTAHLLSSDEKLSLEILAVIGLWMSFFIADYGTLAFKAARFPLLFLLLLIPIPDFLIDRIVFALQVGSATAADFLFRIMDAPVLKEGLVFRFPSLDVEVAKECSGIRSSLVLLITTLLMAEFSLRSGWRKLLAVLSVFVIVMLKNGMRIVTITLLTVYVDPRFLHSWLHTSGGILFYVLGLVCIVGTIILLKKWEIKGCKNLDKQTANRMLASDSLSGPQE
jgi:exosortase